MSTLNFKQPQWRTRPLTLGPSWRVLAAMGELGAEIKNSCLKIIADLVVLSSLGTNEPAVVRLWLPPHGLPPYL
jgi:hypothetical protein